MISQHQWLQTRRKLLEQIKSEVEIRLGPQPSSLRRYAKSLEREFQGRWQPCRLAKLEQALLHANIVLGADFHAYAQSQRAHIRLLRSLPSAKPVVLALECLGERFDKETAYFLSGKISEKEFLEKVKWQENWGFPWEHYRPLLQWARDKGAIVVGLQTSRQNLLQRDAWTARRLRKIHLAHPDALIFVVMGEWHLAKNHLPRELQRQLPKAHVLTVLQDSENLYFKLARQRREESTECLKGPGARFCVMVSPPWLKWQSYLMYLEQTYDRDLLEEATTVDYSDHIHAFAKLLAREVRARVNLTSLQVYSPSSMHSLSRLQRSAPKEFRPLVKYLIEHDRSFLLPQKGLLYLSRPTINHASALAGQFVHAQISGRRRLMWRGHADFNALIWIEAVGFFFSKWINPKRKAENLEKLKAQLHAFAPQDFGREALLLAMEHRMAQLIWMKDRRLKMPSFRPKRKIAYLEAARILGSDLGEKLYQEVRHRKLNARQLHEWLKLDVQGLNFRSNYWEIVTQLES